MCNCDSIGDERAAPAHQQLPTGTDSASSVQLPPDSASSVKLTDLPVVANENEQSSCGSKPAGSLFLDVVPLPQRQTRKIVKRKK